MQRGTIICCVSRLQASILYEAMVGGAAAGFAVVMRAVTAFEKAKTGDGQEFLRLHGIAHTLFEPTERSGAQASHHYSRLPGFAQDFIQPPFAPQDEEGAGIAAAHVNCILFQDEGAKIGGWGLEEREMRRDAWQCVEAAIETVEESLSVSAGGGDEADLWSCRAGSGEDVLIEAEVVGLHQEAASTHGNDLGLWAHCLFTLAPGRF